MCLSVDDGYSEGHNIRYTMTDSSGDVIDAGDMGAGRIEWFMLVVESIMDASHILVGALAPEEPITITKKFKIPERGTFRLHNETNAGRCNYSTKIKRRL